MKQELVIRGSRERFIWMLIIGLCFLVLGYWTLVEQHMWFLGGAAIAFALFGLIVTLLMMRPGGTFLRLDSQGLEVIAMRRRYRYAWSDVDSFYLCKISGAELVGINFSPSCSSQRIGRAFASSLTGVEGAISNLFTAGPAQVCATLNEWKVRHSHGQVSDH
jgi:hypothetical protein